MTVKCPCVERWYHFMLPGIITVRDLCMTHACQHCHTKYYISL